MTASCALDLILLFTLYKLQMSHMFEFSRRTSVAVCSTATGCVDNWQTKEYIYSGMMNKDTSKISSIWRPHLLAQIIQSISKIYEHVRHRVFCCLLHALTDRCGDPPDLILRSLDCMCEMDY